MTEVPKVIAVTASSALLEFQEANDTTHNYQVEYAELIFSSVAQYVKGVKINAVHGQSTYRILQTGLIPRKRYQLRIVPNIYIVRTDYGGIPSGAVQVSTLVHGKRVVFEISMSVLIHILVTLKAITQIL